MRSLKKNQDYRRRSEDVIAHGALTNSKRPQSFVQGPYPTHIESGYGATVKDVDGNEYVDYICSLGAVLFGHRNKTIETEVIRQLNKGFVYSLGSSLEVEVAEMIRDRFHYMESMRFLKTGSEACSAAMRIARAYTGKLPVCSFGYHGWADEFVSLTPPANGIDRHDNIHNFGIGWAHARGTAAVIVEPIMTDSSLDHIGWLHQLRRECTEYGTVLIFDETITGLRFPGFSVAKHIGIEPDITVMGKALGGGLPISVVGGKKEIMNCDYFVSSTFAGDCIGLAGAKAVMNLIKEPELMADLHRNANKFCDDFNSIAPDLIKIEGYGTRGIFQAEELTKALFMQECVKAGILFGPSFLYGTEHSKHDDRTLSICRAVLNRIKNGEVKLEGLMPVKPYAQKVREK